MNVLTADDRRRGTERGRQSQRDRMQERVTEYERLTREYGMRQKDAAARMGLTRKTTWRYEQIVAERTGETCDQARHRLLLDLVDAGLTIRAASEVFGVHEKTGQEWVRAAPGARTVSEVEARRENLRAGRAAHSASMEERYRRFVELRRSWPVKEAAWDLGVTQRTGWRYEARRKAETGVAS